MSLRSRWILIGVVTLTMAYLALPSFFPESERGKHWWLRAEGMTLGLDLQGGVHWLLRVDTDAAIQRELEKLQTTIADAATEAKLTVDGFEIKDADAGREGPPTSARCASWSTTTCRSPTSTRATARSC